MRITKEKLMQWIIYEWKWLKNRKKRENEKKYELMNENGWKIKQKIRMKRLNEKKQC